MAALIHAKRHVRNLQGDEGGGSQAQVLEDDAGSMWMVKARNSPQGPTICVSELVAGVLAARIGASVPAVAVCEVPPELAATLKFADGAEWQSGECFASELIDSSATYVAIMTASNQAALLRVVALDTWTAQYNGRQARGTRNPDGTYAVIAVDFGHAFGQGNWTEQSLQQTLPPNTFHDPHGWAQGRSPEQYDEVGGDVDNVADGEIDEIVASIPDSWATQAERAALAEYLKMRRPLTAELFRAKAHELRGQQP